jgi:hypothetical protein
MARAHFHDPSACRFKILKHNVLGHHAHQPHHVLGLHSCVPFCRESFDSSPVIVVLQPRDRTRRMIGLIRFIRPRVRQAAKALDSAGGALPRASNIRDAETRCAKGVLANGGSRTCRDHGRNSWRVQAELNRTDARRAATVARSPRHGNERPYSSNFSFTASSEASIRMMCCGRARASVSAGGFSIARPMIDSTTS